MCPGYRMSMRANETVGVGFDASASRDDMLKKAAARDRNAPLTLTIRELLRYWGVERRTPEVVSMVLSDLDRHGLVTVPPLTDVWIDNTVELRAERRTKRDTSPRTDQPDAVTTPRDYYTEGSLKIGALAAANVKPEAVKLDDSIAKAITVMTHHNYSQLAVVDGKRLSGAISERSIMQALLKGRVETVRDAKESVREVAANEPVMDLIEEIKTKGYVFVCDRGRPRGVVTTADIAAEFVTRHAPIIAIGDIELRVRNRVREKIDRSEFAHLLEGWQVDDEDAAPTLGKYSKLLKGALWDRLEWGLDKDYFLKMLDHVTHVRNELMHFVPDPPDREQIQQIERFADTLFNLT